MVPATVMVIVRVALTGTGKVRDRKLLLIDQDERANG